VRYFEFDGVDEVAKRGDGERTGRVRETAVWLAFLLHGTTHYKSIKINKIIINTRNSFIF